MDSALSQPVYGQSPVKAIRIHEILEKCGHLSPEGAALVQKAYVYSAQAHAGQTRRSGEPYLSHPLAVADILADMYMDEATIAAGLLHDTVEDTKTTIEEVDELFGEETADIVDGVTKISLIDFDTKEEAQAENIRKMILAMAENIRVLIVKLADRLHNMRTLDFMPEDKRRRIAQETMDIYAPLSNRLGLHRIKTELEDLSFKQLKPDVFNALYDGVKTHRITDKEYVDKVMGMLEDMLKKNKIKGRIQGRSKHLWSIHKKMVKQDLTLDKMHDLVAFRVITDSVKDCYAVLGLVHAAWRPVPGRFKDYVSMPKANMYQSLHTTVIGPEAERIEIQIRTEEMHQFAEHGVASHWLYKDDGKVDKKKIEQFAWLRELLDWQKDEKNSREFIRTLKFDLFKDEVYVFTPRGQVKELPEGATPVDFAYMIHTEVGDHCTGAKVNGKLTPLSTPLVNGDTIEIITDPSRRPSRDWLKFVRTAKARTRISHYIRTEERSRAVSLGKEMLEKEARRMGMNLNKLLKEQAFAPVALEFSFKTDEDLFAAVGYARFTPKKILRRLLPKEVETAERAIERAEEKIKAEAARESKTPDKSGEPKKTSDRVVLKGVDDVLVRFAGCCNPLPGDAIIGYISRGRGVTVHRSDCPNIQTVEPERLLDIAWEGDEEKPYPAKIKIVCRNTLGVLAEIATLLSAENVNIDSGYFHSTIDGNTELIFTVEVKDAAALYRVIDKMNRLPQVIETSRMTGGA